MDQSVTIKPSDGSGDAVYYNNGRYYQYGKYSNYSCNDAFWQTVTKHYNKLGQGDYSTKTWGGQPLQSIVGKTLPDGAYTGQGRHTGGEYFKNPLNDGYDYMYMPGLAFNDNQPRWVLMPMSLRNERWPSLGSQTIDQFIANSPQWYTRKNAVKAIYDAWMSEKVTTKDPIVGEITPLSEDSWSPLAIGMLRKLKLLGTHSEAIETQRNATKITIKKVKESLDKNKVLKFGMKDTEFFQNKSDVLFDWKSVTPDTLYIKNLQNLLNNVALATNKQTISVSGTFDKPTEILLKQLTEKTEITLNQLESIIKEKYGLDAAALKGPYEGYWQTVADLRSKGFKNTECYNSCTNKKEHLDQVAWLEMMNLADEVATKINIALGCQNISTKGGKDNQIPNYSKATAEDLVKNKKFLTNNGKMPKIMPKVEEKDVTILNNLTSEEYKLAQYMIVAKRENKSLGQYGITDDEIKKMNPNNKDMNNIVRVVNLVSNVQIAQSRPYHTYFVLEEMYFGAGVGMTGKRYETGKNMWNDKTFFPDGPWEFFKTYYQTESPSEIRQAWSTYGMEMYVTSCIDVQKPSPSFLGMDMSGQDIHGVLGVVEVSLVVLSFIPSPLSPVFFVLSTGIGLTDSIIYFAEGDTYMGLMMLGFTLMNVPELRTIFKEASAANKIAQMYKTDIKSGVETLAQRYTKGIATESETALMNELKTTFTKNGGKNLVDKKYAEIVNENLKNAKDIFIKSNKTVKDFWPYAAALNAAGKFDVLKLPITLGGIFAVPVTMDQLYVGLCGNTKERMENPLFQMFLAAKDYPIKKIKELFKTPAEQEKEFDKQLKEFDLKLKEETKLERLFEAINKLTQNNKFSVDELEKTLKASFDNYNPFGKSKNTKSNLIEDDEFKIYVPKLTDVISDNGSIFEGMEGESVTEIQKLLKNKWKYNLGDTGPDGDGIDGKFDERMTDKIQSFQENMFFGLDDELKKNNISLDNLRDESGEPKGIVDKTTLWLLQNAKEENLKMPTLKLLPLGVQDLTDEDAKFYVNQKKYSFFQVSKNDWKDVTKEEYEDKKEKGLKVQEIDNWVQIGKNEYIQKTQKGGETKFERKEKEITPLQTKSDDELSRKEKKQKERIKQWVDYYEKIKLNKALTPEQQKDYENLLKKLN